MQALTTTIPTQQMRLWPVVIALGMGVATALCRYAPTAALAVVWFVFGIQLGNDARFLWVELSVVAVAFGCARWGRPLTVALSGASIPMSALIVLSYLRLRGTYAFVDVTGYRDVVETVRNLGDSVAVVVGTAAATVLALPWLAGLGLRFRARAGAAATLQIAAEAGAARAEQETAQVREIAQLREQQAQLARDVHDVVGHSLAVILAQAESAHYLPDTDTAALKQTMTNIATSARSSLRDVRQVLTTTSEQSSASLRLGELDSLIDGMRASGHEVTSTEEGTVRPLPPELEVVTFRVLQEMLTNAIRHGRRGAAVTVRRRWGDQLQIEVGNAIDDEPLPHPQAPDDLATHAPEGRGVDGMRRRLESVGGRLDIACGRGASGRTFTATAWVPVRTPAG